MGRARTSKDWLDDLANNAATVTIGDKTLTLRIPSKLELLEIRKHTSMSEEERQEYDGGVEGWATMFFGMCCAVTVTGVRERTPDEWVRVIAATRAEDGSMGELCSKALDLCGYGSVVAAENENNMNALDEADEALGDLPT